MAYYVRKFSRSKWESNNSNTEDALSNYGSDTITNDMRTQGNTLSVWKAETLSRKDIEPIMVINSLLGDTISSSVHLLCIPEDLVKSFRIIQKDGDTIVEQYKSLHYDISNLSIKLLVDFARDVVLKILDFDAKNESEEKLIIQLSPSEQKKLVVKWIKNGELSASELKPKQREVISKLL